ncbi:gamma-glutamyltranspeptidase / glutathione hydrolase / leukotriene-C4 hydrolase [Entomortierella parvispora]|uniref:Glutathione hydrolase n=1 Tax=Entomortierella parvispora TaxID=205924 RepID=A0A9P3H717_9FUNG|nr:gamma-glutamyltranspeptidase / glutathione hydrolase / leukotriene-C4 hydrolase [Entomortierella parvispora]
MANNSHRNDRSDQLSSAEQGQSRPSLENGAAEETTSLLGGQRRPSAHSQSSANHGNGNNYNNKRSGKRAVSDRTRKKIIISLTTISGLLLVALGATLIHKIGGTPADRNARLLVKAQNGAVATEEIHCSEIGVQVLKDGGNAVDAAIASCLCIGTVNMFSAGIGGGGFMTIRLPNSTVEVIDFRETAPAGAHPKMYKKDPVLAQTGGLSVGVPGEIRGLELAHKRHGKLPWPRLFAPAVKMARDGWAVGPELAKRLRMYKTMMETDPEWAQIFAPNGTILLEGEWIKRQALANTLETIGKEGSDAFYTGPIAQSMVDHIQKNGGILTMKDMKGYEPLLKEPMVGYYQGRKVYTTPAPTSGPVLISLLNILERYDLGRFKENADVEVQRLVEAMKFGYAQRTELGDPDYTDLAAKIQNILSKDTAGLIRANISDAHTFPVEYYNPHWGAIDNHGTTHMSTVDKNDMAVALTSTVNLVFGSKLIDPKTGIILNDEMDDFSIPGTPNAFGLQPSPYNYPEPGKRPLSSCVPTIVERDGQFEMALGGSGGSRILTSVLQTMLNVYNHDYNIMEAIEAPRVHHQLMPNVVDIESGYVKSKVEFLRTRGHDVTVSDIALAKAEVQAVMRESDGAIFAASDSRKHGMAAGY